MPDAATKSDGPKQPRRRVFVVRPWHNQPASLYPHMMDGVEYVGAVIKKIKSVFRSDAFEVRVDEDVFVPGITIRQNLERELTNADVVLAILDGLRPNVVYELGFAYGQRADTEPGEEPTPRIVCLADRDATVLVRNYYPEPLAVPTTSGTKVTILNPRLNMASAFSDNADLLLLMYSRLDLDGTLGSQLQRLIDDLKPQESKQAIVAEAVQDEAPEPEPETGVAQATGKPSLPELWKVYGEGRFDAVVDHVGTPSTPGERKVLALALMKLGRLYEAIRVWRELAEDEKAQAGTLFHLGVCYYVINEFEKAAYYFERANKIEHSERAERWLDRTNKRLAQRATAGSPGSAPSSTSAAPSPAPAAAPPAATSSNAPGTK